MEKVFYSQDDKVDYFLHKISLSPNLTMNPADLYEVAVLDEESYLVDQIMLEKGLIKIEKDCRVITGKGLEIANFGGWSLYQKLYNEKQKRYLHTHEDARRFEKEAVVLKTQLAELQKELDIRVEKDVQSQSIIQNLVLQHKYNKVITFVAGLTLGVVITSVAWAIFMQ